MVIFLAPGSGKTTFVQSIGGKAFDATGTYQPHHYYAVWKHPAFHYRFIHDLDFADFVNEQDPIQAYLDTILWLERKTDAIILVNVLSPVLIEKLRLHGIMCVTYFSKESVSRSENRPNSFTYDDREWMELCSKMDVGFSGSHAFGEVFTTMYQVLYVLEQAYTKVRFHSVKYASLHGGPFLLDYDIPKVLTSPGCAKVLLGVHGSHIIQLEGFYGKAQYRDKETGVWLTNSYFTCKFDEYVLASTPEPYVRHNKLYDARDGIWTSDSFKWLPDAGVYPYLDTATFRDMTYNV